MTHQTITSPRPDRPGLVDLAALTTSFAIGLTKGRDFRPTWISIDQAWTILTAVLVASPAAAACVILVRTFRFGCLPRSIEWAVILLAAIIFAENLSRASYVEQPVSGKPGYTESSLAPGWLLWTRIGLSCMLSLTCLVLPRAARDRLPAGIKTILILIAAMGLWWGPGGAFADVFLRWIWQLGSRSIAQEAWIHAAGVMASNIAWTIPAASALIDHFWRGRRISWTERLAYLAIISDIFLTYGLDILISFLRPVPRIGLSFWPQDWFLYQMMTLLLSFPIALGFGPTWSRWIGSGYDNREETPTTPEA